MNKNKKRYIGMNLRNLFSIFVLGVIGLSACTKMDDTYDKFWNKGENIYPASTDSLKSFAGNNRIMLQWLNIGDPTLKKAVIYWNNRSDSLVVPIEKNNTAGIDTVKVFVNNLSEGTYSFEVYTYDQYGNRSVPTNVIGKAYGDSYSKSLLTRLIANNRFADDVLTIDWGDPADKSSIGIQLKYKDTDGKEKIRFVEPDADSTIIEDFGFNASKYFKYRTLFLPDSTAIDTFYTSYESVRVLGPRTRLDRSGWAAIASSYDERKGDNRKPKSALDGNTSSAWINQISTQTYYPHWIQVDMQSIKDDIYGLDFYFAKRNETPSVINVSISDDGTSWNSLGFFDIENENGWQYIDFPTPESFRYFKVVAEAPSGNNNNIVIYELGTFTR